MRVDSQLDDKDLREKMKLMKAYSPQDFGIEKEFSMMSPAERIIKDDSQLERLVCINQSGLNKTLG